MPSVRSIAAACCAAPAHHSRALHQPALQDLQWRERRLRRLGSAPGLLSLSPACGILPRGVPPCTGPCRVTPRPPAAPAHSSSMGATDLVPAQEAPATRPNGLRVDLGQEPGLQLRLAGQAGGRHLRLALGAGLPAGFGALVAADVDELRGKEVEHLAQHRREEGEDGALALRQPQQQQHAGGPARSVQRSGRLAALIQRPGAGYMWSAAAAPARCGYCCKKGRRGAPRRTRPRARPTGWPPGSRCRCLRVAGARRLLARPCHVPEGWRGSTEGARPAGQRRQGGRASHAHER